MSTGCGPGEGLEGQESPGGRHSFTAQGGRLAEGDRPSGPCSDPSDHHPDTVRLTCRGGAGGCPAGRLRPCF